MTETQSMEERIADLLKSPDGVPAATFALMIRWVDAKIIVTERDAREALKAFKPLTMVP
jgi:hypothetical protein